MAAFAALAASKADLSADVLLRIAIVAEHFARSKPTAEQLSQLLATFRKANAEWNASIISGLSEDWPSDHALELAMRLLDQVTLRASLELATGVL